MRNRIFLAAGVVVAVFTAYLAGQQKPVPEDLVALLKGGLVLSGENFGFQIERAPGRPPADRGYVTGTFVVKIDGRWVEARPAAGIVPLTAR